MSDGDSIKIKDLNWVTEDKFPAYQFKFNLIKLVSGYPALYHPLRGRLVVWSGAKDTFQESRANHNFNYSEWFRRPGFERLKHV